MRTQQGSEGGVPLPGGSCGSSGSGSLGLSPGSDSEGGSPTGGGVDRMVDGGLGVGGCMGGGRGGGSLGGTLRGVLSHYWSLESLHSTTGKSPKHTQFTHTCCITAQVFADRPLKIICTNPKTCTAHIKPFSVTYTCMHGLCVSTPAGCHAAMSLLCFSGLGWICVSL